VDKYWEKDMETNSGVYIMRVASMLSGMHPQTLRKYERAGLLAPMRCKQLRMYSDEDIARLKIIKHLVDDLGLNLAGVRLALQIHDTIRTIKKQLSASELSQNLRRQLLKSLDDGLAKSCISLSQEADELAYTGRYDGGQ
jgi:MerR family transcriptional regulator, heat shock protein HspR